MSRDKEPHYFSFNSQGYSADAYLALWPRSARIMGESSTSYSKFQLAPHAPELISAVSPRARFVYLVRDPVDRIESHFNHNLACSHESQSVHEAFAGDLANNNYILTSSYFRQISRFVERFGRDNVMVIDSNDLRTKRQPTMDAVFQFLGVNPIVIANLEREHHKTADLGLDRRFVGYFRSYPKVMKTIKGTIPRSILALLGKKKRSLIMFDPELRARLYAHLRSDIEALEQLTNRQWPGWKGTS